jgi:hypothetical protein
VEPLIKEIDDNLEKVAPALSKIGDARAIVPLITKLTNLDDFKLYDRARYETAKALTKLYHHGRLDAKDKQVILTKVSEIQKHAHHVDKERGGCGSHEDLDAFDVDFS